MSNADRLNDNTNLLLSIMNNSQRSLSGSQTDSPPTDPFREARRRGSLMDEVRAFSPDRLRDSDTGVSVRQKRMSVHDEMRKFSPQEHLRKTGGPVDHSTARSDLRSSLSSFDHAQLRDPRSGQSRSPAGGDQQQRAGAPWRSQEV